MKEPVDAITVGYNNGQFDALNTVLTRLKTCKFELKSQDYVMGVYEAIGIIDEYFNELNQSA